MAKIYKMGGLRALYKGLAPVLLISVPSTMIYYVGYEIIRDGISDTIGQSYAPVIAGLVARTFAVTLISPFELLRTRVQAGELHLSEITKGMVKMVNQVRTMEMNFVV